VHNTEQCQRSVAVAIAMALVVLLSACGSSSSKPTASAQSAQVKQQACKQVEAALSDGPEPQADPVGYAQAQVLPLRQIHTTDATLQQAISTLADAYQAFSSTHGASQAKSAVSAATSTIEHLCPGIEL
jgi:hypothetical protein